MFQKFISFTYFFILKKLNPSNQYLVLPMLVSPIVLVTKISKNSNNFAITFEWYRIYFIYGDIIHKEYPPQKFLAIFSRSESENSHKLP